MTCKCGSSAIGNINGIAFCADKSCIDAAIKRVGLPVKNAMKKAGYA